MLTVAFAAESRPAVPRRAVNAAAIRIFSSLPISVPPCLPPESLRRTAGVGRGFHRNFSVFPGDTAGLVPTKGVRSFQAHTFLGGFMKSIVPVRALPVVLCLLAGLLTASSAFGGFEGTEQFIAATGNPVGGSGAHFDSTFWATNL